jgi:membrane-associated phospholipid phosphatase
MMLRKPRSDWNIPLKKNITTEPFANLFSAFVLKLYPSNKEPVMILTIGGLLSMFSYLFSLLIRFPENLFILGFSLLDHKDDRRSIPWSQFLWIGVPVLALIDWLWNKRSYPWLFLVNDYLGHFHHVWNWNHLFRMIPWNDGSLFRLYKTHWLTVWLQFAYSQAFVLNLWVAIIRSFLIKDVRKMLQYALGGFVLQMPVIIFFYHTVLLQEVWYVKGDPDGLMRGLTGQKLLNTVANCFPSMHTSVAFAILLLALREKGPYFKWGMVFYCASVIYSTLYLEIHWVIDVISGMALAYVAVRLSDIILNLVWNKGPKKLMSRLNK